jgi:hypothetical protein
VSYDLEIATREPPEVAQIEAWAGEKGLVVVPEGDASLVVENPSARGEQYLFLVELAVPAEAEDFSEETAGACLAPKWMTEVQVPYSVPKKAIELGRSLARHLAESYEGAAFDRQDDRLLHPRGKPHRVGARQSEENTELVKVEWFLPRERWAEAPATLLHLLRRRCPEALPRRYGRFEPPQGRFDLQDPSPFIRFVLDEEEGDGFWFSGRPSFGGFWRAPHADRLVTAGEERLRIGHLEVSFDGLVLRRDPRWLEAIGDLFAIGARELGAFFGAAQVETGWVVSRNNRLHTTAESILQGAAEHIRRGAFWQGLPPVPMWLSWFGPEYRELVEPHLTEDAFRESSPPRRSGALRRLFGKEKPHAPEQPRIERLGDGLLVRLAELPATTDQLGGWPVPPELTYKRRTPIRGPNGVMSTNPAQPGDEAPVIPALA